MEPSGNRITFEVPPQLSFSRQSLEHIKMVSFPAGGENEAGSWSCRGERLAEPRGLMFLALHLSPWIYRLSRVALT